MLPRGVRNNNPGNIIKSGIEWQGELKQTLGEDKFEVFDTPEHGVQALGELLLRYQRGPRQIKNIRDAIGTWAPPTENDTAAYIAKVARDLKVADDAPLDFSDPPTLRALAVAIGEMECGAAPFHEKYTDAIIDAGISAALGIRQQDVRVEPSPAPTEEAMPEQPPTDAIPGLINAGLAIAGTLNPGILPIVQGIAGLISGVAPLFGKKGEKVGENLKAAGIVAETAVKVTGAVNEQQAYQKMLTDPAARKAVSDAVLADERIATMLEIGPTGVDKARDASVTFMDHADKWWKLILNPVLIVTAMTLPLVYIIVLELTKWMFRISGDVIAQTIGTVLGLVLGGIMGFWMGQTYQQNRQRRTDQQPGA